MVCFGLRLRDSRIAAPAIGISLLMISPPSHSAEACAPDAPGDAALQALRVSTIISLAQALKLKVVAEGVETEEQSRLLRLLSCDEMQGLLFSKAVPGEIFEAKFLTLPLAE